MGTTISYGLLAWVVGVICPHSGLDNPAVTPSSAAGDLEAFSTIATAYKLVKRPAEFPPADKKNPATNSPNCDSRRGAGQGRPAQAHVTRRTGVEVRTKK